MTEDIKVEPVDIDKVCRVCLQEESQMASIFARDRKEKGLCLYEKIERCVGIKILTDPELPTRICRKCKSFLTIADKFRIICTNSDNYLRDFVCEKRRTNSAEKDRSSGRIPKRTTSKFSATAIRTSPDNFVESDNGNDADAIVVVAAQVLQIPKHEIDAEEKMNYVDVDGYTEFLMNDDKEDDLIEEDPVDTATSSKTLGTTSDAVDIKPKKSQKPKVKEQIHICDICGNCFPRKYSLEVHVRRHRDERPHECEICGQAFHLQFQLTRHMRKHTGKRPFSCQFCQRNFSSRAKTVEHEIIHRNERPFSCETCGKRFNYSNVLKNHILTHTGEKPFNCGICGKRFSRAHHLRAHLETLLHSSDPRTPILLKEIKPEEGYFKGHYEETS